MKPMKLRPIAMCATRGKAVSIAECQLLGSIQDTCQILEKSRWSISLQVQCR